MNQIITSRQLFWIALVSLALQMPFPNPANAQNTNAQSNDWKTIKKLLQTQVEQWNAGNIDGFMQTYWNSPDFTFSGGGTTTREWQATLDRYKSRYPDRETMGKLGFDNLEHKSLGDTAALVLGTWHLKTAEGNPHGNFSLVLQKIEGKWLIIHDHSSTVPDTEN